MIWQCSKCDARMSGKRRRSHVCAPEPPKPKAPPKRSVEDMTVMGRRLKEFRDDLGWTQTMLAKHLRKHGHQCSRSYIDKIEWQIKVPNFKMAKTIRRVMLLRGYKPALLHPRMNLKKEPMHYRRGWKKRWLAEVHAGKRVC